MAWFLIPMLKVPITILLFFSCLPAFVHGSPQLGVEVKPENYSLWDINIFPDGKGLPAGSGTAGIGEIIYTQKCQWCHGLNGQNGINNPLVGGRDLLPIKTVGNYWPYATTVFDYIRRAMPFTQPQSLTNDEVYALTAYLLYKNGIIERNVAINAENLPLIKMPNRDNFTCAYPDREKPIVQSPDTGIE